VSSEPVLQTTLLDERALNNLARGLLIIGLLILFLSVGHESSVMRSYCNALAGALVNGEEA
jgi:hypothetical protein